MKWPRRFASASIAAPSAVQVTTATTDASAPNAPPVSHAGPLSSPMNRPCIGMPEVGTLNRPLCVKFQAAWMPIASQRRRVSR